MKHPLDAVGIAGPRGKITTREYDFPISTQNPAPSTQFKAQLLKCLECGELFAWSVGDQQHYERNGLQPPQRCPGCRAKKRESRRRRF